MNIYEISCNGWLSRVKASSASVAVSKGLRNIAKDADIDSVNKKYLSVGVRVLARKVSKDTPIPKFEKPAEQAHAVDASPEAAKPE